MSSFAFASSDPPRSWRFELALRTGYSEPFGDILTRTPLRSFTDGYVPLWLDAGLRLGSHWVVGLYVQFSPIKVGQPTYVFDGSTVPYWNGRDDFLLQLGVALQVHPVRDHLLDPWLGFGIGYERRTDIGGLEVRPELGVGIRLSRWLTLGPFFSCAVGQYTYQTIFVPERVEGSSMFSLVRVEAKVHGWATVGVNLAASL